jgi:protein SCO1/2
MQKRICSLRVLLLVLAVAALAGCAQPYTFKGTEFVGDRAAPDFTLTGADGQPVSVSDFRDKVVVLYFGYTFCPDVCPTTLTDMKQVMQILGKQADDVQFIMVSVDPERDTPEKLKEYVTYFDPRFIGVTGTPEEVLAAATPYGVIFEKHEGTAATGYLVDHTATLNIIDKDGKLRLLFPFDADPKNIADDLKQLVQ